ncbi:MAG: metallophosphoesterase, partial [Candidatus Cloacimonetes bacterium]|nr:metallophosphoesterase [Candidatus Cloacimonadota bacterium]
GDLQTQSGPDGSYLLPLCWSGTHDLRVQADGFHDYRDTGFTLLPGANSLTVTLEASGLPAGLKGCWTFEDPADLTAARNGNPLELVGSHAAVPGPQAGDAAVSIGVGSFYRCFHDIPANGAFPDPAWVNRFTLVMDVRLPYPDQYRCLYQTNWSNSNDGDCFINVQEKMGLTATGYSETALIPGEWYRLAIRADLGVSYDYFLDGHLLHQGGAQAFEGRFSLYPAEGANQVLFFADDDGEDGPIEVAGIWLYDRALDSTELLGIGGYGHEFISPLPPHMIPYLQAPTSASIRVGWHSTASSASTVEYGTSPALGQVAQGSSHLFDPATLWHTVKLDNLQPDTEYWYRALSDTASSEIHRLRTLPEQGPGPRYVRFGLLSDNQTQPDVHRAVIAAMKQTFIERWGPDVHNSVQLILNTGDIVDAGNSLEQYQRMYFNPIADLSGEIPFMTAIGNHEGESALFYEYMHHEDHPGQDGHGYYALTVASVRFLVLNSNRQTATQLAWFQQQLDVAEADPSIQWIFALLHHPSHSETWPDGNTAWVRDEIIPRLAANTKAEQLFFGHTHAFELGAHPEEHLRTLCFGGGGGHLDRWGLYANQTDYPEIHASYDVHGYTVFEIDTREGRYQATAYTLGHEDHPRDNTVLAQWGRDRGQPAPETPTTVFPAGSAGATPWLVASPFDGTMELMSSQFQLTTLAGNWNSPLVDSTRDWQNIYNDSGSPDFDPVDLNQGIDLRRLHVPAGQLQAGQSYRWRMRYRDRNLLWSDWSDTAVFTATPDSNTPAFLISTTGGPAPLHVEFTDLSSGLPLSFSWDLDGDGFEDSQDRDPAYTFDRPGTYSPSLTVTYSSGPQTVTQESGITVSPGIPVVVITLDGNQLRLSWATQAGAIGYRVHGAEDAFGPFILEPGGETTATQWSTPVAIGRRCYRVTAVYE